MRPAPQYQSQCPTPGNTHYSFVSSEGSREELLQKVAEAASGGINRVSFTGVSTRVGVIKVPDWEIAAYRSAWADVEQLDDSG